jgi:hypothetical protein
MWFGMHSIGLAVMIGVLYAAHLLHVQAHWLAGIVVIVGSVVLVSAPEK